MSQSMSEVVSESSWWSNSSWFKEQQISQLDVPTSSELPCAAQPRQVPKVGLVVGGAAAQSRFADAGYIPQFHATPKDGAPDIVFRPTTTAIQPSSRGQTCDGTMPQEAIGAGRAQFLSRWEFNVQEWQWRPKSGTCLPLPATAAADKAHTQIAARRWGDGRDTLLSEATSSAAQQNRSTPTNATTPTIPSTFEHPPPRGFATLGGLHRQKRMLTEAVVLPLKLPRLFSALGVQGVRGVLLHGPPGSGKSALARAVAEEAGAHLEVVEGGDVAGAAGEGRLKAAFKAACANEPAVVVVEEADCAAPSRDQHSSETERQSAALLMALIDEARLQGKKVAVVAISSRPAALEPSMRRPGRLDVEVVCGGLPAAERLEALCVMSAKMPLTAGVKLDELADEARGFMAADLMALCTEAASACIRQALGEAGEEATEGELLNLSLEVSQEHLQGALECVRPSLLRGVTPDVPRVSWDDIGGLEEVKRELQELISLPLRHPEKLAHFGIPPGRGALLHGPPGCGKTLLAKAAATHCGANFIAVQAAELLDMWLGNSELNVRQLFATARAAAPCVIFFDEVDALAPRRGSGGPGGAAGGDAAASRVLNQMLAEMDGVQSSEGLFILGATNRPDSLDPAFLRPGRLGQLLEVGLPDEASRLQVARSKLRKVPQAPDVDLSRLAAETDGFSAADVSEICREAGTAVIRQLIDGERQGLSQAELEQQGLHCLRWSHVEAALLKFKSSNIMDMDWASTIEEPVEDNQLMVEDSTGEGQQRQQQQVLQSVVKAMKSISSEKLQAAGEKLQAARATIQQQQARIAELEAALASGGQTC